jgi:leucine-rich repeat-containing G protein-coupled receptor 7/leucine-rich repeat-containing G protein-coupled receptor 8
MLPVTFDHTSCHSQTDLLSSCKDLLKSDVYRVFLWAFAVLAVVGNVGSLVGRVHLQKDGKGLGSFGVFVTNLSLSDVLMGIYLVLIGVKDRMYQGEYILHDQQWRTSTMCNLAGVLSLMSNEVSAFIVYLITLDRFLVTNFPFSQAHFKQRSAMMACGIAWLLGLVLAVMPLLPVTSHWKFFGQTGICMPLRFVSSHPGYTYTFSIMIVLNFKLFLCLRTAGHFLDSSGVLSISESRIQSLDCP